MKSILVSVLFMFFNVSAFAGAVSSQPVSVDYDTKRAAGDLLSARTANDDVSLIGCGVKTIIWQDGVTTESWGFCQATDSMENSARCWTENPVLLNVMGAAGTYNWIGFSWFENPADGICNGFFECICKSVDTSNNSFYLPDLKDKNK